MGELPSTGQSWYWGRSRYSALFQEAGGWGRGEHLSLGPQAHFSSRCPQDLTPRGCPMPMFFRSFLWNWGGRNLPVPEAPGPKPAGGRLGEALGSRRPPHPGEVQFQEVATRWGTTPTNGDTPAPGPPESRKQQPGSRPRSSPYSRTTVRRWEQEGPAEPAQVPPSVQRGFLGILSRHSRGRGAGPRHSRPPWGPVDPGAGTLGRRVLQGHPGLRGGLTGELFATSPVPDPEQGDGRSWREEPESPAAWLCEPEQQTTPLRASVSPPVKWDKSSS